MPFLDFEGKGVIASHHLRVPFRSLQVDKKKSFSSKRGKKISPSLDDNLIIHGDNLHALKALLPRYSGKVKCIYIDPPYNTGNEDWKYNDNVNSPQIKEWLNKTVGTDDLERHDKWLCMMWPRLQLLKELLSGDGVIFISTDDNEQHRLRTMMDEIFGENNFITNIIWQKKYAPANDAKYFSDNHDFILCYVKNRENGNNETTIWKRNLLPRTEKQDKLYKYDDKDGKGPWRTGDLSVKSYSSEYDYIITNPNTGKHYKPPQGSCWRTSKEKMRLWIKEKRIFFGKDGKGAPQLKRYLNEVQAGLVPLTIWTYDEVGHTDFARKEIKEIFHDKQNPFDNPKPSKLICRLIQIGVDKNAIILDSFAGSGTTAQAVLNLNKEDGGNRKFILVECEDYADKTTAERVRRVIKGVPKSKDEKLKKGLGGSFTYCTLGVEINTVNLLKGKNLPDYTQLAEYVFYTATGKSLNKPAKTNLAWFIGETELCKFHLIYKPDIQFLRSKKGALNLDMAEKIKKFNANSQKTIFVFAPETYMEHKELKKDYNMVFCHLPYAIHKIIGV